MSPAALPLPLLISFLLSLSLSLCLPLSPPPTDSLPPHSSFTPYLSFSLCIQLAHSNGPRPGTLGPQEIRWELGMGVCVCVRTCVYLCFHLCLWAHMSVYSRVCVCALCNKMFFFHSQVEYLSGLTEQDEFSSLCHHKATDGRDGAQMWRIT